jgi:hypothetical protein
VATDGSSGDGEAAVTQLLLCAWCLAKTKGGEWSAAQASTIYKGQALCVPHFEETRALEPYKPD